MYICTQFIFLSAYVLIEPLDLWPPTPSCYGQGLRQRYHFPYRVENETCEYRFSVIKFFTLISSDNYTTTWNFSSNKYRNVRKSRSDCLYQNSWRVNIRNAVFTIRVKKICHETDQKIPRGKSSVKLEWNASYVWLKARREVDTEKWLSRWTKRNKQSPAHR